VYVPAESPFSPADPPQPSTPKTRSRRPTPSTPTPLTTPQQRTARASKISTPANATSNAASRNSASAQNTSESSDAATGLLVRVPLLLPALSSCLPVYPLIYHSISEEIPEASRPLVTRLYQLWLVLLATLLINMLACIFVLVAGASDGGKDLGGSIGCAFLFPSDRSLIPRKLLVHYPSPLLPLVVQVSAALLHPSFPHTPQTDLQWLHEGTHSRLPFKRLLTHSSGTSLILLSVLFHFSPSACLNSCQTCTFSLADSTSSSASTCRPFLTHAPHVLTPLFRIIGIPSTGSAGLIQTIQMFSQGHWAAGILGTIATVGWSLQGVGNAFYYRQVCPVSAATYR
jgi:hypothetical protein